jgi:hypothetical protein
MLRVRCRTQYLTRVVGEMRGVDYDGILLVKAAKRRTITNGQYSEVVIDGQRVRITDANKDRAVDWFAEWGAAQIATLPTGPKVLVPVPSSKTTLFSDPDFVAAALSDRIARRVEHAVSFPRLRFSEPRASASEEGGSRDPAVLYEALHQLPDIPEGQIILVDDMFTSGGHLRAAAWRIQDQGRMVENALCFGKQCDTQLAEPFNVDPEEISIDRE